MSAFKERVYEGVCGVFLPSLACAILLQDAYTMCACRAANLSFVRLGVMRGIAYTPPGGGKRNSAEECAGEWMSSDWGWAS